MKVNAQITEAKSVKWLRIGSKTVRNRQKEVDRSGGDDSRCPCVPRGLQVLDYSALYQLALYVGIELARRYNRAANACPKILTAVAGK